MKQLYVLRPILNRQEAHFNPEHKEHGFDNPKGFHVGDLPNLEVDAEGKVTAEVTTAFVTLKPDVDNYPSGC